MPKSLINKFLTLNSKSLHAEDKHVKRQMAPLPKPSMCKEGGSLDPFHNTEMLDACIHQQSEEKNQIHTRMHKGSLNSIYHKPSPGSP